MDLNDVRIGVTLASLLLFVGIVAWTWRPKRRDAFREAAQLPFREDETP
jgi:cytochrome c oxidase cbb3-type subunit 4